MNKIAVVGAGIVGLISSLFLAKEGYNVELIEARKPGFGASGHNAGVLHMVQPPPWSLKAHLARRANPLYDKIASEVGFEIKRMPALLLYRKGEKARAVLTGLALKVLRYPVRLVSKDIVEEACQLASPSVEGAVLVEGYGSLVPWSVVSILYDYVTGELGVEPRLGVEVSRVAMKDGEIQLYNNIDDIIGEYGFLVNAAGGGAAKLAESIGLKVPEQRFFKGSMALARVDTECNAILAGVHQETRSKETKGGGVIPWPDGRILLGPDFEETRDPWDTSVPPGARDKLLAAYRSLLRVEPVIEELFAGTRVKNKSGDFHIITRGRSVHFLGIDSPGFTAAPLLGEIVVKTVRKTV